MVTEQRHSWRVERSLCLNGGGYGAGWLAMQNGTGIGAWFRTWAEAMKFAREQVELYTPRTKISHGEQPQPNPRDVDKYADVPEMIAMGISYKEIASAIGVTPARIYQKFPKRADRQVAA